MRSLAKLQRNWEGLAQADPLWAICVDPTKRGNKWTLEEFRETGRKEIETVLSYLRSLGLELNTSVPALDFGCGIGRLTRPLSQHFSECWGVDISPTMIRLAQELHSGYPRCKFWLNDTDRLSKFSDAYFGFAYTSITLQHIPRKHVANYLREFARVLSPHGALVFQVADTDRNSAVQQLRNFIGFRRRWKRLLSPQDIDSFHMEMHCIPGDEVRRILSNTDLRILDVRLTNSTDGSFNGDLRILDREPQTGYVSKQYCAVKQSASGP